MEQAVVVGPSALETKLILNIKKITKIPRTKKVSYLVLVDKIDGEGELLDAIVKGPQCRRISWSIVDARGLQQIGRWQ